MDGGSSKRHNEQHEDVLGAVFGPCEQPLHAIRDPVMRFVFPTPVSLPTFPCFFPITFDSSLIYVSQHDVNKDRTPQAWEAAASRHKRDIAERRHKIILERKGKGQASKSEAIPVSTLPRSQAFLLT
jgi:hypothetical protein